MKLPSLDRVRAGVRTTRDAAGRVGTVGGAAVLAASLTGPQPLALVLTATATAAGYAISVAGAKEPPPPHSKALYLTPASALMAEAIAFPLVPGLHWWEITAAALWTALTWWLRPARLARDLIRPPEQDPAAQLVHEIVVPAPAAPSAAPVVDTTGPLESRLASFWAAYAAAEDGPAPGTRLQPLAVAGPQEWSAHIVATHPGQPVPRIPVERLSALMDIPEDLITIGPVPGAGAGRRLIRVGNPAGSSGPQDFASLWTQHVAPAAMPGTTVVSIRRGTTTPTTIPTPTKETQIP